MAFGGFDFLTAEKDISKKVEELASVVENVATIFLNGVGSLEKQLEDLKGRLSKVETQMDTVLRIGGSQTATSPGMEAEPSEVAVRPTAPAPGAPQPPPGIAGPPPRAPTSPLGATSGLGIKAQMQGELKSFLARRRAALEASMQGEE